MRVQLGGAWAIVPASPWLLKPVSPTCENVVLIMELVWMGLLVAENVLVFICFVVLFSEFAAFAVRKVLNKLIME